MLVMVAVFAFVAAAEWSSYQEESAQQIVDEYDKRFDDQFSRVLEDPKSADYAALNATMRARDAATAELKARGRRADVYSSAATACLIVLFGVLGSATRWRQVEKSDRNRIVMQATMFTLACAVVALFPIFRVGFTVIPWIYSDLGVPGLVQAIGGNSVPTVLGWLSVAATIWLLAFANLPSRERS